MINPIIISKAGIVVFLSFFVFAFTAFAAMDPRFELDPHALVPVPIKKLNPVSPKHVNKSGRSLVKSTSTISKNIVHTVKSGDNLFKILMRDYALSNEEAEIVIDEIRQANNIFDIKRLKVGQKIIIPAIRRNNDGSIKTGNTVTSQAGSTVTSGQSLVLQSPISQLSEAEANARFKFVWDKLIPESNASQKPISIQSPTFSLTLDPQRYPSYTSMDGGRILVDSSSTIPPLVKVLINEKDPTIRVVSESPVNCKQFLTAMISAGGFYSVEEDFALEYGTDPKLTVSSNFKIEKTSDSLLKQDVVLINSGRIPNPSAINSILSKEGFNLFEPFASHQSAIPKSSKNIHLITTSNQLSIVDSLLSSISIAPEKDLRLDVLGLKNNGIALSVKAERYFERNGQRNVVTRFDGDPVTYTLFRILETMGYRVTILDSLDTFKNITEKLSNRLQIQTDFAQHAFEPEFATNYSLKMSAYKLNGAGLPKDAIFVTNLNVDPVIREILSVSGYSISSK